MTVERTWEQRNEARRAAADELERRGVAARLLKADVTAVADFMVDTGTPLPILERLIFSLGVAALLKIKPQLRTLIGLLNEEPVRLSEGEDDLPF